MDSNVPAQRRLRQSLTGSWDICGRRAQLSLTVPRTSTSEASHRGSSYHRALEAYYNDRKDDPGIVLYIDRVEQYVDIAVDHFLFADYEVRLDSESRAEGAKLVKDMVVEYFTGGWYLPPEYEILQVEAEYEVPISDRWIGTGIIDLVTYNQDQATFEMFDHKTAGRRWPASKDNLMALPQAAWYSWLHAQVEGQYPNRFHFDVLSGPTQSGYTFDRRSLEIDGHSHLIDAQVTRMVTMAMAMDALDDRSIPWPANPGAILCSEKYCDYWTACPYGQALHEKGDQQ